MKAKFALVTLVASLALIGCGGGGGATSPTPTTPPPTTPPTSPPVSDASALQATVPPSAYAAGSVELAAFTSLNAARAAYGVGLLADRAPLATSAKNHATYIIERFKAGDFQAANHTEDPTKLFFTGVTPADRAAHAKYAGAPVGENLSYIIEGDGVQSVPGNVSIEGLLSAPYHRAAFFDSSRDVGFGHSQVRLGMEGGVSHIVVANFGVPQGTQQQLPAADWVGLWPTAGATNVMYSFAGEVPDPIPVNKGACAGYPVSVQARNDFTLSTTAFTLTETVSGAPVSVQLATKDTDANPSIARANTAYIIPFRPLKLNTQYTAHFVGARNGVALDKSWSFTTLGQNTKKVHGCDPA